MSQPPPGYKPYDQQGSSQDETMESEVEFVDNHDNGDVEVSIITHFVSSVINPSLCI